MTPAHFTATAPDVFEPTEFAKSHWGDDHLGGPAIVGLAAYALEKHCGSDVFMPSRLTVDLFRAARGLPTAVSVRVVRDGFRVRNAECDITQNDRLVARAVLTQYRRSAAPPGQLWEASTSVQFPPVVTPGARTAIHSDSADWSQSPAEHQNDSRKCFYNSAIEVVSGFPISQFARAAMTAEATSLVTNLGTRGVGYINGDLSVALARLPVGDWIAVQADSHRAADGIAVGTATLFDRTGAFGSGMITAIANPAAQIDFADRPFPLRGLSGE